MSGSGDAERYLCPTCGAPPGNRCSAGGLETRIRFARRPCKSRKKLAAANINQEGERARD